MVILIHKKAKTVIGITKDGQELPFTTVDCTSAFWELAERFPDELIAWCEQDYLEELNLQNWETIFHHDLIMASYAIETVFLPDSIGYIDQLPFININREVQYGTWLMSSDMGGLKGDCLLKFKNLFSDLRNFDFLLNSIGKIGQQNGLFCYSSPGLTISHTKKITSSASTDQIFEFVYRFYDTRWLTILLWCFAKYEKKLPLISFMKAPGKRKFFQLEVDFSSINTTSRVFQENKPSIDVIIPTIGRQEYLLNVLEDLREQSLLPSKVIIIEQHPEEHSKTELSALFSQQWPFEIVHRFIQQTGACNARNIALNEVSAEWIFFADDDIRIGKNLLEDSFKEIKNYSLAALNLNCKQQGEETVFYKVKQWGSFGSGTSIVKSIFAKKCKFPVIYEHGYGEDIDFGMQLRNHGCDIIYHPNLIIVHLKAPIGGFRQKPELEWEKEEPLPKPSPTLMVFAFKFYTPKQLKGFKTSLFLKYYNKQPVKNPVVYSKSMNARWKKSEEWAKRLLKGDLSQ